MEGTYTRSEGFYFGDHYFKGGEKSYTLKRKSDGEEYTISGNDVDGYILSRYDDAALCYRDVAIHYDAHDDSLFWDDVNGKFNNFIHAVRFLRENIEKFDRLNPLNTEIVWRYE